MEEKRKRKRVQVEIWQKELQIQQTRTISRSSERVIADQYYCSGISLLLLFAQVHPPSSQASTLERGIELVTKCNQSTKHSFRSSTT